MGNRSGRTEEIARDVRAAASGAARQADAERARRSAGRSEDKAPEGFFRSVIDAALDAVIVMDADGIVMHWNQQAEATFGWTQDEAVGQLLASLIIPPERREAHARGLRRFLTTGEAVVLNRRIELTAVGRTGAELPVELTVTPFMLQGRVTFTGFVRDITERKQAEAQRGQQIAEAQLLYQATRLAAESTSFEAALQGSLDIVCRMTGWPVGHVYLPSDDGEQLIPSRIWHIDDRDKYGVFREVTEHSRFARGQGLPGRVWQTGEPEWFENASEHEGFVRRMLLPEPIVQTAFAFPVTSGDDIIAVLEFVTDADVPADLRLMLLVRTVGEQIGRLIERKRAEEALRWSEQRFRDFATSASDWLWETDAQHRFVWLSSNVHDRVSVPPEWHYGRTRLELMEQGTDPAVVEAHRRLLDGHQAFRDFEYLRRGPREDTWLSVSGLPMFDAEGQFRGYRGVSRDITERKRAEAHREMLLAELQHRVRNSLTVVKAIANCTGSTATTIEDFLARFAGRIGALATAHELLTHADWGGIPLSELVLKTLQAYWSNMPERIDLEVGHVVLGPAVAQTLSLAVHELAVNATKHGALSVGSGKLRLRADAAADDPEQVELVWVESGGPPAHPPRVTGFGLSVIRRAIEDQHEGRVELDWREEGLVCRMRLPLGRRAGQR